MDRVLGVIVTYNAGIDIIENIKQAKKNVGKLLVVDNGSKLENIKFLEKAEKLSDSDIEVIYLEKNMGIAYAINVAFHYAEENAFDWVLTLDQDSRIFDGMVNSMLKIYRKLSNEEKRNLAILVPTYYEQKYYREQDLSLLDEGYTKILTEITSGNLVKTDIFSKVGYLKEDFFIDCVDHEFCLRINKNSFEILKVHNALMLHNLGDKIRKNLGNFKITSTNHSSIRRYYMTRNRMWLWKEYKNIYPQWIKEDKMKFIRETVKIILFEKNKLDKIKMILKGISHYNKRIFGVYT